MLKLKLCALYRENPYNMNLVNISKTAPIRFLALRACRMLGNNPSSEKLGKSKVMGDARITLSGAVEMFLGGIKKNTYTY